METNGKEIKKIFADFVNGEERRVVEVQDVEQGKAFVQPVTFNPDIDKPIYYHGWITDIENIKNVRVTYSDGQIDFLGDPPASKPVYIVAEIGTLVP